MTFTDLAFVSVDGPDDRPVENAWSPLRSGNFEKDCATGRRYFSELYRLMKSNDNPMYLSRVLAAQARAGKWEGVEIGFAQAMAEQLL